MMRRREVQVSQRIGLGLRRNRVSRGADGIDPVDRHPAELAHEHGK